MNTGNYQIETWFENRQWHVALYACDEFGNRVDELFVVQHEDAITLMGFMGRCIVERERQAVTA